MQQAQLVKAAIPELPAIRELAVKIWNQYYPAIISQAQITYMLEKMYSVTSLRHQAETESHDFYFIERSGARIGFLSVKAEDGQNWFINKFYIDQDLSSNGIGSDVFRALKTITGAARFRLTVNRLNFKAINFYFKNGFKIEEVADFDIGNGYQMNDFVMVWQRPMPRQRD